MLELVDWSKFVSNGYVQVIGWGIWKKNQKSSIVNKGASFEQIGPGV